MIYLYVKQHASTCLKYFGKTIKSDPFAYKGSGKYWLRHLKQHGRNINTLEIWGFDDQHSCTLFALKFSADHDIVSSNEWANLCEEDGRDGGPTTLGKKHSPATIAKMSATALGRKSTPETKAKLSKAWKTRVISEETKKKMKSAQLARRERERTQGQTGSLAVRGR